MMKAELKKHTGARVFLGNAGSGLPTKAWLDFRLSHAKAVDSVFANFDPNRVRDELIAAGIQAITIETEAKDHSSFLLFPAKGRRLDVQSKALCETMPRPQEQRIALVLSAGLSAIGAQTNGVQTIVRLSELLRGAGIHFEPVFVLRFARVAIGDEIGFLTGSDLSLVLVGERPGLDVSDSVGGYLTYSPHLGCSDAERNCISNIHAMGLPPLAAAEKLLWFIRESLTSRVSGVRLKDLTEFSCPKIS